ncbi:MAG: hypothetical protein MZU97_07545 [Bacillus subtilis]|nr:hypothetical protein [Bacillus subtilis]
MHIHQQSPGGRVEPVQVLQNDQQGRLVCSVTQHARQHFADVAALYLAGHGGGQFVVGDVHRQDHIQQGIIPGPGPHRSPAGFR